MMWDVGDVGCWGCEMFRMWDVGDVLYSGGGMFGRWDVQEVESSGCGMLGMWDVGCLPACGVLIYKMPTFISNGVVQCLSLLHRFAK